MLAVHRLIEKSELHFQLILGLGPCRVKTKRIWVSARGKNGFVTATGKTLSVKIRRKFSMAKIYEPLKKHNAGCAPTN